MGTPYGKRAIIEPEDGEAYREMYENAARVLREQMTETEYRAWQYRAIHSKPFRLNWRDRWMAAAMELAFPTQCTCSGTPDREIICDLCKSLAHVSSLAEVGV